jgi:hypothetical protein
MSLDEAISYIEKHPNVKDVYGLFGRSMCSGDNDLADSDARERSLLELQEEKAFKQSKHGGGTMTSSADQAVRRSSFFSLANRMERRKSGSLVSRRGFATT